MEKEMIEKSMEKERNAQTMEKDMDTRSMTKEMDEPMVSKDDEDTKFKLEPFVDALREVNNEVLQIEEIKSQTEKLQWDLIRYLRNLLNEYDLTIKIPSKSLSGVKGLQAMHCDKTGIVTYHFRDGSIKSFEMRTYPPTKFLNILHAMMPQLKTALKLKKKKYEHVSSLLSKVEKNIMIKEETADWPKQHSL
jgi:hypothetical protein